EAVHDLVEDHAVQLVYPLPAELAGADLLHRRRISRAPGQRELVRLHVEPDALHVANDGPVPVHHGAEHIEGENSYHAGSIGGGWRALGTSIIHDEENRARDAIARVARSLFDRG